MKNNRLSINPTSLALALASFAALLVLISIGFRMYEHYTGHGSLHGLIPLFTVGFENNIPNTFSSLLLFLNALILVVILTLKRKSKETGLFYWAILAFGFLFMSFDESIGLHERLTPLVLEITGNSDLGFFYYAWVIPAIIFVLLLGLFFVRFLINLPQKTRLYFLLSSFLYLGGAIGLELIGGRYHELHGWENIQYYLLMTVEESLEMAGCILFSWTLLKYIGDSFTGLQLRFDKVEETN